MFMGVKALPMLGEVGVGYLGNVEFERLEPFINVR
jgi:hypothetical protein